MAAKKELESPLISLMIDIPVSYGQSHPNIKMGKKTFYDGVSYDVTPDEARELRYHMEQIARHDSMVRDGGSYRSDATRKRLNASLGKRER